MRGPTEEMTRGNQTSQRQQVPFVTIFRHEKGKSANLGEVLYEERVYPPGTWACVSKADTLYEQSISNAFMKLMRLHLQGEFNRVFYGTTTEETISRHFTARLSRQ
ncbi:hypothetical protein cypCar_00011476 [Cyprinus carpio]|nr:hypothetical protein cypCar_00011476 [Cyprinus carpio]